MENEFSEGHSLDGHEMAPSPTPPQAVAEVVEQAPTPLPKDNLSISNIKRRWTSETPPFFRTIHRFSLWFTGTCTTLSGAIFGLIQQYPSMATDFAWLSKAAGICALIGVVSAIQAKMAVTDKPNNKESDENKG